MPKSLLILPLLALLAVGCNPNQVFEQNTDFANYSWDVQKKPAFTFAITDTLARYDVYFNVRNAADYPYYNLFMKATLRGPDGPEGTSRLHQMLLLDPKTGEPHGSGTGDIYDHSILALPNQRFGRAGRYTLTLEQYMRQDRLPGLMAVGVRVVKRTAAAQ